MWLLVRIALERGLGLAAFVWLACAGLQRDRARVGTGSVVAPSCRQPLLPRSGRPGRRNRAGRRPPAWSFRADRVGGLNRPVGASAALPRSPVPGPDHHLMPSDPAAAAGRLRVANDSARQRKPSRTGGYLADRRPSRMS
jgi:hypothetical protein